MRARALLMSLCAALAVGAAASAAKPQEPSASQLRPLERDALYVGRWSAAQMLGTEVRTNNDEPLGVVTDLIVGDDGALHTLVIARRAAPAAGARPASMPTRRSGMRTTSARTRCPSAAQRPFRCSALITRGSVR